MSALDIIEQIKELPPDDQVCVARFIVEKNSSLTRHQVSIGTEGDGLPVIRATGGNITSQLVRELESRLP